MKNKILIYFILMLVITFDVKSQKTATKQVKDSLKLSLKVVEKLPNSLKRDSLMIKTIFSIIEEREENVSLRKMYLDSLRKFSQTSKWIKAKAYYYFANGFTHVRENELYAGFDNLEKALIEFRKLNDFENVAYVNNRFIPLMNWNMIENKIPVDVQSKYLQYMQEASALARARKDTAVWANIDITMAAYYVFVLKDFKNGYSQGVFIQNLIENKKRADWFDYYNICELGKSISLLNMNQEKKGLEMIDNMVKNCQKNSKMGEARYVLSQTGVFVGRYFLEKKDYKNALKFALLGEKYATFLNFPYFANVLNKLLYETYKNLNQPAKAFQYLERVKQYEDESESKKMNETYTEWQLKYEDEKQKTQIKSLENEKLKRQNDRQDLMRNVLIISLLFGTGLVLYVFWNNKKLKTKNEELKSKNDEISGAMFKGQTIERKRVASELHDNLNTKIVALKWRFEAIDTSKYPINDQKILADFTKVLDDIYMDVRLISHNLMPVELESHGLAVALQKLLGNISNQNITFHFRTEGIEERFDQKLEHELYHIALELINNILKHSQASQTWVSLTKQEDKVSLSVSDNGKGIDLSKISDGVGLRNVHSRVENLNGKLQINRQNTQGTLVQIDVSV